MKKELHPELHPVIFRDTASNSDFFGMSTRTTKEKETVEGVEYSVLRIEVSSASHPFYTGEETIIDAAGRVEKFTQRAQQKAVVGKKQRKNSTATKQKQEVRLEEVKKEKPPVTKEKPTSTESQ